MLKLFLSSHGHFASGIKSSVEILTGSSDKLTVFDAFVSEDTVQEQLDIFFKNVKPEDEVILLSDLYGGSVNQTMYLYLQRPNTRLIAGVNLSLVLELCCREEVPSEELEALVQQSREMLRIVSIDTSSQCNEDFF